MRGVLRMFKNYSGKLFNSRSSKDSKAEPEPKMVDLPFSLDDIDCTVCISSKTSFGNLFDSLIKDAKRNLANYISMPSSNHFDKLIRKNFQMPLSLISSFYSEKEDAVLVKFYSPLSAKIANDAQFSLLYDSIGDIKCDVLVTTVKYYVKYFELTNGLLYIKNTPTISIIPFNKDGVLLLEKCSDDLPVSQQVFVIKEKSIKTEGVKKISLIEEYRDRIDKYRAAGQSKKNVSQNAINSESISIDYIDNYINGFEFESLMKTVLENNGFKDVEVTKSSGDFGVDIIALKDQIKYAIQCKKYSSPVGISAVQEVIGSKSLYDCHVAVVLTNNTFTSSAKVLAEKNNVLLWDRAKLIELLNEYTKKNPCKAIPHEDCEEREDRSFSFPESRDKLDDNLVLAYFSNDDSISFGYMGTFRRKHHFMIDISSQEVDYANIAAATLIVLAEAFSNSYTFDCSVNLVDSDLKVLSIKYETDNGVYINRDQEADWLKTITQILKEEKYYNYAKEIVSCIFKNIGCKPKDFYWKINAESKLKYTCCVTDNKINHMFNVTLTDNPKQLMIFIICGDEKTVSNAMYVYLETIKKQFQTIDYSFSLSYNNETVSFVHTKDGETGAFTNNKGEIIPRPIWADMNIEDMDTQTITEFNKALVTGINKINCYSFVEKMIKEYNM